MKGTMLSRVGLVCLLAAVLLLASPIWGQTSTGSVRGDVVDQSGAVVPDADVSLQSVRTGEKRAAKSSETGSFVFPLVLPGVYSLTVTRQGFSTVVVDNITVNVGQVASARVELKLGQVAEQVTVEAAPVQVNATDASLGAIVGRREATNLPILGRSFLRLAALSAGTVFYGGWAASFSGGRDGMSVGISGAKDVSTVYLLDGSPTKSAEYGNIGYAMPLEMVDEFNIQRGFFSAKYPGPGVVNVASRGGSNEWHGTLWHTIRNQVLNANNFFDNFNNRKKAPLRQNQFGALISMPILKDKLFWTGNFQMVRERRSSNGQASVPTAAELSGDFSNARFRAAGQVIQDPFTKLPYPNSQIPKSLFQPFSQGYNQFIPPPTQPGVPFGLINRIVVIQTVQNDLAVDNRVDIVKGSNDRIFVRFGYGDSDKIFGSTQYYSNAAPYGNRNGVISYTRTFSPVLINEFHFGYDRVNNRPNQPWGPGVGQRDFGKELGIRNVNQYQPCASIPAVGMLYGSFGVALCGLNLGNNYHYSDNVSYVRGAHSFNFGFQLTRFQMTDPIFNAHPGDIQFQDRYTNHPVGDYLMGTPWQATALTKVTTPYRRAWIPAAYVEDTVRVRRNLTLNFGLRWELPSPAIEKYDQISAFVAANESFQPNTPYKILLAGKDGVSRRITDIHYRDFSPRFGFAWQPGNARKISIRGSYGLFYETMVFNENVFQSLGVPFVISRQITSDPNRPTIDMSTLFDISNPEIKYGGFQLSLDPYRKDPYLQQWTLSIERELPASTLLSAAYVGSHGTHMFKRMNWNVARPGATPVASRLPFPDFGGIIYDKAIGSTKYHALQIDVNKKTTQGISFRLGYTWSRSMDMGEDQNFSYVPWDTRLDWRRSKFDFRHRVVFSGVYELPFGTGKAVLNSLPKAANKIVEGWQLSGIGSMQSGAALDVGGRDLTNTGAGLFGARVNRFCNGNLPAGQRTRDKWFDTSCFAEPPAGVLANGGLGILDGPGFIGWDLSLGKNTRITEKLNFQFRVEAFNAFNRVNFGNPTTNVTSANYGKIFGAGASREIQFAARLMF